MIDQIDFCIGKKQLSMALANKLSPHIYKTDSINLLIGQNGSGKTQTIKAIISRLVEAWPLSDSDIEIHGDTSNLAVVYYTSAPFSTPIKVFKAGKVGFKDASNFDKRNQPVAVLLGEYLAASEIIGTDDALKSITDFNITRTTTKMVEALIESEVEHNFILPDGASLRLKQLNKEIESLEQDKNALYRKEIIEESESHFKNELKRIEYSIKKITSEIKDSTRDIAQRIRYSIPERLWVPICSYIDCKRPNLNSLAKISAEILMHPNKPYRWQSHEHIETVIGFVNEVEASGSGQLNTDDPICTLVVDLGKLIKRVDAKLIERAYKIGLIKVTFEHVSSGQAAIFHQIINISSAINSLAASGKRDFLIFIDEGDILLHLEWQRRYIEMIDERLGYLRNKLALKSVQIIIASHSPLLASDVLKGAITTLGNGEKLPAFGAPLQRIVNYGFETTSIGSIAERTIEQLFDRQHNTIIRNELINQIDNEFIRNKLLSMSNTHDS